VRHATEPNLHPLLHLLLDDEGEQVIAVFRLGLDVLAVDVLRAPFQVNDGVAGIPEGAAIAGLRVLVVIGRRPSTGSECKWVICLTVVRIEISRVFTDGDGAVLIC